MPFKLDVDRLLKDELVYELKIRGIAESDNVDALRKSLRSALSIEKDSSFVFHLPLVESTTDELDICETKLKDISTVLSTFSGSISQVRKVETKICHTNDRLHRFNTKDVTLLERRSTLLKELMDLIGEYNGKVRSLDDIQAVQQQNNPADPNFSLLPVHTSSPSQPLSSNSNAVFHQTSSSSHIKSVPVYKWQIKFSGKPSESFNAFLEEVDEHCRSRCVDKAQLFESARDLFAGDALRLYSWLKRFVTDWDGLVALMKDEYIPSADKLWQQILARTQGESESVCLYVAIMIGLFDRMPTLVTDSLRLQVLRKNILPFFQERLALTEIKTPFELIELCRKIEITRDSVNSFRPPNLSSLSLEPDLAYLSSPRRAGNRLDEINVRELVCWRCKERGHVVKDCSRPKHDFQCYSCGRAGFTKSTCPTCNKDSKAQSNHNSQSRNDTSRDNWQRDRQRYNNNHNNNNNRRENAPTNAGNL